MKSGGGRGEKVVNYSRFSSFYRWFAHSQREHTDTAVWVSTTQTLSPSQCQHTLSLTIHCSTSGGTFNFRTQVEINSKGFLLRSQMLAWQHTNARHCTLGFGT